MSANDLLKSGNNAFSQGDYARALVYYRRALGEVRGDPDLLVDLYGNLGNVYGVTGQTDAAIECYKAAVDMLRLREDYGKLGSTFVNIGNLYADRGDAAQAIQFYKQGMVLLEREGRDEDLITLYGNLSLLSLQQSNKDAALDYAEKGVTLAKQVRNSPRLADALHRLAKAKEAMGSRWEALRLSESAHAIYVSLKDEMGRAATLYHQAGLFEEEGRIEAAIRALTQVVAIDEKYSLPKLDENRARLKRLEEKLKGRGQ
jgi:tetratricopeptide (TPR) repeat protein